MYTIKISEKLHEILTKMSKKDKALYDQLLKKIEEIANSQDVDHYKNLSHDMKDSKRVHIGSFVLIFQFDKRKDELLFDNFDHHDNAYRK